MRVFSQFRSASAGDLLLEIESHVVIGCCDILAHEVAEVLMSFLATHEVRTI